MANAEPTLLDKYKLLGAVINAPWSTSLDHKVIWHVIERYMTRHGNSRASLRYLGNATGAKLDNVTISLRRLVNNGVISVNRPGRGTRPTEYALHVDFSKTASVPASGNAKTASVPVDGDESLLRNPLTSGLTVRGNDAHAATGPSAGRRAPLGYCVGVRSGTRGALSRGGCGCAKPVVPGGAPLLACRVSTRFTVIIAAMMNATTAATANSASEVR
jgi:hypothetical protein